MNLDLETQLSKPQGFRRFLIMPLLCKYLTTKSNIPDETLGLPGVVLEKSVNAADKVGQFAAELNINICDTHIAQADARPAMLVSFR